MEILNYKEIEEIVAAYIKSKCNIIEEVSSTENISFYLENVIRRRELEADDIHNLRVVRTFDMDVFKYNVRKSDCISNNILVTKNDSKLFSIEETSEQTSSVNNYDLMFSIYNPSTSKLEKKIRIQKLDISGTLVNKVIILNKIPNSFEYERKEFKLYIQDGKILCVKKEKDDYYFDDTAVNFMIDNAVKIIDTESRDVLSRINDILHNEKVKEYTIKKKNDKRLLMKVSKK